MNTHLLRNHSFEPPASRRRPQGWRTGRAGVLALFFPFAAWAQATAATGAIEGRVFNAATQAYVRNVRIEIPGTNLQTFTDNSGRYSLAGVPAGAVKLRVFYTGTGEHTIQVIVPAGHTVRHDLSLSGRDVVAEDRETIALDRYVVSETREMDARAIAINEQRFAVNAKTVVAADAFGDSVDGNVGEFIKNMSGVVLDGGRVSIRGLPGSMTPVTIDGADLANGSGIKDTRAVDITNLAINNISRVEVTKAPTPDMAASSVGGSLNLVSKSAFELARPQFKYRAMVTFNEEYMDFAQTPFPDRDPSYKYKPSFDFSYTVPLNKKFGFSINAMHNQQFSFQRHLRTQWNSSTSPSTPTNPFLDRFEFNETPQVKQRQTVGLTADWQMSDRDTLSATVLYNPSKSQSANHVMLWNNGGVLNQNVSSYSPTFALGRAGSGTVEGTGHHTIVRDITAQFTLRHRHRGETWTFDSNAYYGKSKNRTGDFEYGMVERIILFRRNLTINFQDIREGGRPYSVTARDSTTGANVDAYKLSDVPIDVIRSRQNRNTDDTQRGIKVHVARQFPLGVPVRFKTGLDLRQQIRDHNGPTSQWSFVGADRVKGTADEFAERYGLKAAVDTSPGFGLPPRERADNWKMYELFKAHPEYFVFDEAAYLLSRTRESFLLDERISAGFLMADAAFFSNRLRVVGGVRYEETADKSLGRRTDPTLGYQTDASGRPIIGANGRPEPIADPIERARRINIVRGSSRKNTYGGLYPSLNAGYAIMPNLLARFSYARTLGRPDLPRVFPDLDIRDTNNPPLIVTTSGNLKPWESNNYDVALEYYFKTVGVLSVSAFRKDIENYFGLVNQEATPALLAEFELGPEYSNYRFNRYINAGDARVSGVEIAYDQALTFLPKWASGFSVFANGSRLRLLGNDTADFRGFVPRVFNAGLSYDRGRLNIQVKRNHRGQQQLSAQNWPNSFEFRRASVTYDLNAQVRFTKRVALFVTGRNLTNEPTVMQWSSPATPDYAKVQRFIESGAQYAVGLKGTF
jgi:TonB-dependent receptor